MRKLAWAYRILLVLGLLVGAALLLALGVMALARPVLTWLVGLYPPYTAIFLIAAFLLAGVLVIGFEIRDHYRLKRQPSSLEPLPLEDYSTKIDTAFSTLAARYGGEYGPDQNSFTLPFPHLEDAIWCAKEEDALIVGLVGSPHHAHFFAGNASFPAEAFHEIEDITSEKQVHAIFYDKAGKEHYNDLYQAEGLDEIIYARLHPFRAPQPWWQKALRLLFLWFPPFRPNLVRAEIFPYRAAVPRVIRSDMI